MPQTKSQNCRLWSAVVIVVLITGIYLISNDSHKAVVRQIEDWVDYFRVNFDIDASFFVVIIDAGSTGTRIFAYGFHRTPFREELILDSELYYETTPGLSTHARHPEGVRDDLNLLLLKAKMEIPESRWSSTPVNLKATAGFRLLEPRVARNLLDEIRTVLDDSGFQTGNDSAVILDAKEEGVFAWLTVNYLLGNFLPMRRESVGVLDLGGASTQMTYRIDKELEYGDLKKYRFYLHSLDIFDRQFSLYSRSILGLGIEAARREILVHPDNWPNDSPMVSDEVVELNPECIHPKTEAFRWSHKGITYLIRGPPNEQFEFFSCAAVVRRVVEEAILGSIPNLNVMNLYAVSKYFDRVLKAGLIDAKGGTIKVESILKTAELICPNPNPDNPFLCVDLIYSYVLLHNGLGLKPDSNLTFVNKINGHEISWGLGAGFSVLRSHGVI